MEKEFRVIRFMESVEQLKAMPMRWIREMYGRVDGERLIHEHNARLMSWLNEFEKEHKRLGLSRHHRNNKSLTSQSSALWKLND